ncbi:syncoilin-like [Nelusetta ayraudi]|uniref:syncoilin-like n=1 Tax=Nelusetta ayraudi TaxID=303726 RepID=UPI003F6F0530
MDKSASADTVKNEFQRHPVIRTDWTVTDRLRKLFDHCIQQVSHLETQRNQHIQELLGLHEPMLRELEILRRELQETHRMLSVAQLSHAAVFEEVVRVKRKLFAAARDCIQSQVTLETQKYEVAQSVITREEFKAHIQILTVELLQLREAHQNQLAALKAEATKPHRSRTASDVGQCRQASIRLQRRLSGCMEALGGWYEPRLVALLRRRQMGEEALRKIREQKVDLKARVGPLRAELQRLEVQRVCLEQRLTLMESEMEGSVTEYEETVEILEETLRVLQVEWKVQEKMKKDVEERNSSILSELESLREPEAPQETTADADPHIFASSGYF